jgi:hypothetical protein
MGRLTQFLTGLLLVAGSAGAAESSEFSVTVSPGKVVVAAKGKWHINQEYPWRLVVDGVKLDKSKFTLSESAASVQAPRGAGKLKGSVCSEDQCKIFEEVVTVP